MTAEQGAMKGEDVFFGALLRGDGDALRAVLTADFLLIDVMSGSELPGDVLIDLVSSRQLRFESVERIDSRVRPYGNAAVVTGQTRMRGSFEHEPFEAHSRSLGDRSHLTFDADGGVTLYVQTESPGKDKESNWLPAPASKCSLVARVYGPSKAAMTGAWKLPPLEPTK